MDAFEQIVAGILRQEGFWTWIGYKINLSKSSKAEIGKPSLPRPEIDILAYQPQGNLLRWVECKSYLWSYGVNLNSFTQLDDPGYSRYKIFNQDDYRKITEIELIEQLNKEKLISSNPKVEYCLATGHIRNKGERKRLHEYFNQKEWQLFDEFWIKERLERLAKLGYENDISIITAKLFADLSEVNG